MRVIALLTLGVIAMLTSQAGAQSLVERLGHAPTDKLLIINCDDFGMSHAENQATFDSLVNGVATSATVMMPCPWVPEVARWRKDHPGAGLGVHLTLTSEWSGYRWAGVLGRELIPSLLDDDGYLPRDNEPLWEKADVDEAYAECRAQVERAIAMGLEPTHLDNHMGSIQTSAELWPIYLRLAEEFDLPVRMADAGLYAAMGEGGRRDIYADKGILGPDVLIHGPWPLDITPADGLDDVPRYYNDVLRWLKPGTVTELYLHTGIDGPELQAISGSHERRQADRDWLCAPETRALIDELGITLINYRPIRELQRNS